MTNTDTNIGYVQVVRQTWQERYDMYMQLPKEELARMLAEQAKYISPEQCKEFEIDYQSQISSTSTYSSTTNE